MEFQDSDIKRLRYIAGERYAKAAQLRMEGKTYKQIGVFFGLTATSGQRLVCDAWRKVCACEPKEYTGTPVTGLSTLAKNALLHAGCESKEDIERGVKSGAIHDRAGIPNYGKKSHKEVLAWLGVKQQDNKKTVSQKTIDQYIRTLERNGYTVTKKGE